MDNKVTIPANWEEAIERMKKLEKEMRAIQELTGCDVQVDADAKHKSFTVWLDNKDKAKKERKDTYIILSEYKYKDSFYRSVHEYKFEKGDK